jgi:hypothetical protein
VKRRIACTLVALTILLSFSATFSPAVAAPDYTKVGAIVGTTVFYDAAIQNMHIDGVKIRVIGITGSLVTLDLTHYYGGAPTWEAPNWSFRVDETQDPPWFIVSANLSAGDALKPGSGDWTVDYTTNNYQIAGRNWTANHVTGTAYGAPIFAYIDKPTGIMLTCRYRDWIGNSFNYTMTSYTFEPSPPPAPLLLAVGAVAAILAVMAAATYVDRRQKPRALPRWQP